MTLTKREIKQLFKKLSEASSNPQKRGFEFEKLLHAILENEKLEPKSGYKPLGEQIDGSFFWEGQTFLLEAKWVNSKVPASSIYAFKGKLDGKFHSTSGIFISINGYSEEAEDALKFGKTLNIILFDGTDINLICEGKVNFIEVLKFKLRQAGDTGSLLVPYEVKAQTETIQLKKPEHVLSFDEFVALQQNDTNTQSIKRVDDLLIFVEGKSDIEYVRNLLEPVSKEYFLSYKFEVLQGAGNVRKIPSILNIYRRAKAAIVFLDDDQQSQSLRILTENITEQINSSLSPTPTEFFFISKNWKQKLENKQHQTLAGLREIKNFNQIENFIRTIAIDYYDPEKDIPKETLKREIERLKWNYNSGVIEVEDEETGHDYSISDLDSLIEHLEESIIQAMHGEMPLEWLKEKDYLDYSTEVREYLHDYHQKELIKLGWNE